MVGQQFLGVGIFLGICAAIFVALGQLDSSQLGSIFRELAEINAALAGGS